LTAPTLVFHGTADQTIPISVSRQLEAKVPDLVELVETPAAGHVMSWNADPERYERYLRSFLERL
jgi:pimeloyl-ACP methyl ester carboxylesterase